MSSGAAHQLRALASIGVGGRGSCLECVGDAQLCPGCAMAVSEPDALAEAGVAEVTVPDERDAQSNERPS